LASPKSPKAAQPASTESVTPVMALADCDAKNQITSAISVGSINLQCLACQKQKSFWQY
jgi:hypothetical protein